MKFKPQKHIHSKTKSECNEISTYQCIVSKILSENFDGWTHWRKKCIPTGLTKMLDQRWLNNIKAPQCENTMEDDEALSAIYDKGFLYKYNSICCTLKQFHNIHTCV